MLTPGRTCWRLERAERFRCVQDGAEYFRLVRGAILRAEHSIFILGWDISGRTDLLPGESPSDGPTHLDDLIRFVARKRPRLQCYILIWDYGSLYTLERDPLSRFRLGWRTPRRVRFGYDDHHPFGGCHHQKVVVVDDRLAFSGGLDLTGHRWDTTEHLLVNPDRVTPTGKAYEPYHEVQAMVEGPAAASLGELARDRWRTLGAKGLPPVSARHADLWPSDVEADLRDVDVAISRTIPSGDGRPAVRECEALFFESIAAAKKCIYIENQYFTSERLGEALAKRLAEPDGPEIVVVSPFECSGWLEKSTMGAFREQVFQILRRADTGGRLRLVHPRVSRSPAVSTFIHSKVMVVDDTLLRIGSANFSNRSLGMDTECDVSVAVTSSDDRRGIRAVRSRLLADQFGTDVETIDRELQDAGSLCALIDARANRDRTLVVIEPLPGSPEPNETARAAADPDEPIGFGPEVDRLLPAIGASHERSPFRLWIVPLVVLAAAVTVAWSSGNAARPEGLTYIRGVLETITSDPSTVVLAAALFVAAAMLFVPAELLIVVASFALGPERGALVSLAGAFTAAAIGYAVGRAVGPSTLARWLNPGAYRTSRQLCAHAPAAIAVLRLATVASSGSIDLLCGAGKVRFRDYLLGSLLGLLPVVVMLSALGGLLRWTLLDPSIWAGLAAIGFATLLAGAAFVLRTFLLIRQFAPITAGHRTRAEFG